MVSKYIMCQDFRLIFDLTGVPVAWMLSSNTQCDTFTYFLNLVQVWNLAVRPTYFMTDCNQAQISAVETVFPQTHMLLCQWHMLHAIQSHFQTNHFPELWIQIKKLVWTSDVHGFGVIWDKIWTDPAYPQSFVSYFKTRWIPNVHMWSAVTRKYRTIYEESDTNML